MLSSYLTSELVTRQKQLNFQNYLGILPNPDKILSRLGKNIDTYRELLADAHIWSCIQSRKSGLLGLDFIINQNSASLFVVNEIEKILNDIDIQNVMRDILEALLYGYQPMEIIWDYEPKTKRILPKKLIAKPQEWFFVDAENNWKMRNPKDSNGTELPPYKFIIVTFEQSYQNPYGTALLSKCYWPVTFKNGGLRFWVNFMEKYGMPILLGQYSRGASLEESQELANVLANMTQDAVIVTPSDISVELKEAVKSSSSELYKDMIKHCNTEISKAILSQTLTTELDGGSYAAAQTHYKIRKELVMSDAKIVEQTINQLIRYIVELNYGGTDFPKFKILHNDSDNLQKVERDIKLNQCGVIFTKKYYEKTYGLSEDEFDIISIS